MDASRTQPDDTDFAPAARANERAVQAQRDAFLANATAVAMLEAMPGPAMVLNAQRQIIASNSRLADLVSVANIDTLLGRRVGEAFQCPYARVRAGGCGTSEHCATCGAGTAIVETLATHARIERECRIVTESCAGGAGALDFRVLANHVQFGGEDCVILGLTDISGDKRRQVLERVFFHDLLNEVGGVNGLAEILLGGTLAPEEEQECKRDIGRLSRAALDEIQAHREMLAAERGELFVSPREVNAAAVLDEVVHLYRHHPVADDRVIDLVPSEPVTLHTDPSMLRRSLGNLVKNALEAITRHHTVSVGYRLDGTQIVFFVHNPGVIPRETQLQIFERSFSTKGEAGRGVGTYSVRLFIEGHLKGRVGFTSNAETGTEFHITLPLQ